MPVAHHQGQKGCCCFISTACCRYLGLADDCEELEILRRYRDTILYPTPEGRRDIEIYYRQAPLIVDRLDGLTNREQVYSSIYWDYLIPAIRLIQTSDNAGAYRVYKSLVADLSNYLELNELGVQTETVARFGKSEHDLLFPGQ